MKSMRVQNFRSIEDSSDLEFKPITLFLGGNGTGKSTLLRLFPLLKQSVEARTIGPLLLFGDYVDFGDFHDVIKNGTNEKFFSISFEIHLDSEMMYRQARYYNIHKSSLSQLLKDELIVRIELKIAEGKREDSTRVETLTLKFFENIVGFSLGKDGSKVDVIVNNKKIAYSGGKIIAKKGMILPRFVEETQDDNFVTNKYMALNTTSKLYSSIFDEIKSLMHGNINPTSPMKVLRHIPVTNVWDGITNLKEISYAGKTWKNSLSKILKNKSEYPKFVNLHLAWISLAIIEACDDYIWRTAKNTLYINPLRATAERYYRPRDLAVDQVDPRGQNLPMYLLNLSDNDKKELTNWTEKHFGFSPEISTDGGHVSINIRECKYSAATNLADTGFGYSQVLPVIVQLWHAINNRRLKVESRRNKTPIIFAIEQPELHLHPHFQAMLADAFAAAIIQAKENKVDLILLVETHSKTIINRFGHLINRKKIESSDLALYLFEHNEESASTVITNAEYESDGFLKNWPYGFLESGL